MVLHTGAFVSFCIIWLLSGQPVSYCQRGPPLRAREPPSSSTIPRKGCSDSILEHPQFFIVFHENLYSPPFLSAEALVVMSYDTVIAFENGLILCA